MTGYFKILSLYMFLSSLNLTAQVMKDEYVTASVLASGKWFKMGITEDGIYRISFEGLKQLGLENPANPVIYGNNAGQLSFYNDGTGPDDLLEMAVFTVTGGDGVFNEGDYLLFYGKGTRRFIFNKTTGEYDYKKHYYSDTAYYFITSRPGGGKKVRQAAEPPSEANFHSSVSDALHVHEIDAENLIKSGREWYQPITYTKDTEIDPRFKNVIASEPMKYRARFLARSPSPSSFRLSADGSLLENIPVTQVDPASTTGTFAQAAGITGETFPISQEPVFSVRFMNNGEASARAWIDYVCIHARILMTFEGITAHYTDSKSVAPGIVTEFTIKSTVGGVMIWDVSDPINPESVKYVISGDNIRFKSTSDTLKTFVAFVPANAGTPVIYPHPLPNQDLHSSADADMVIVAHPFFTDYAAELASFHNENSGLVSLIVTAGQIYNEFSGGIPDINAIRNFLRMKYQKQKGGHPLKYLLLFGDGSFENKTSPPGNPNFIPTWQSSNSNIFISSFSSDDFYGLLEDGEGEETGTEDIGIGRLPVSDTVQARIIVSKIKLYLDPANQGDWKNNICIIADDEDGNTHMSDAEGLAGLLADSIPWLNVDKIYFDAYKQISSATGQFYPDVSTAINDRINSGTLIFNYIGHGNESSLGHERVLTEENIESWNNKTKLPLFITATCEFSRFDDIDINIVTRQITGRNSAGEKILFRMNGGSIALMSTTRLVYSAPNYLLNRNLFDAAFDRDPEGNALRLGDIIRIAKNRSGNSTNKRNFVLLGDPAVRLSYPWHGKVVTDSINNIPVSEPVDTLKALSEITITGHIEDLHGAILSGFNGIVSPVVYDKPSEVETLANDGGQKMKFSLQNNMIFSGRTNATDGKFSFTFIVPRDIDYKFGKGKISYYASDQKTDMNGVFDGLIAGGFSNNPGFDTTGPVISLYLNDTLFREGGITDGNPRLYAIVEDPGGINTAGTGAWPRPCLLARQRQK